MTKEKKHVNLELLKLYNSPIYRKKIKRVVEQIKAVHNLTRLPGKPNKLKDTATEKERELHAKKVAYRPDRDSAHFWAQPIEAGMERRLTQFKDNDEA